MHSNNYWYIHPEKKGLVVSICCHGISQSELARQTGIGIMYNWRSCGDVFLEGLLEQTTDLYLYEIKERLEDIYGANYTESTISQALERCGWTRKKVTRPS
ncbi:hypothetical protein EV368DRAFT_61498 [Lentinula lateritia]|nr:hypothetical protein EV368DRAFT_61498 [Lentinula lateritia]